MRTLNECCPSIFNLTSSFMKHLLIANDEDKQSLTVLPSEINSESDRQTNLLPRPLYRKKSIKLFKNKCHEYFENYIFKILIFIWGFLMGTLLTSIFFKYFKE